MFSIISNNKKVAQASNFKNATAQMKRAIKNGSGNRVVITKSKLKSAKSIAQNDMKKDGIKNIF